MITVLPVKDEDKLAALYAQNGQAVTPESGAVAAADGDELLGFCLFETDGEKMTVGQLEPQGDLPLADGILRSALHVAVSRGLARAVYSADAPETLFRRLGFIENEENRELNIGKLFVKCQDCQKN